MRLIYTLSIILLFTISLEAQSLKGVWRGTFEQNNLDPLLGKYSHDSYRYEVQINEKNTGALEGVTYSYLTTVFYGKAALKGIFNKKSKTLTIKETVLLDVKSNGRNESCLMTCYLDYKKNGKTETLIGTFSSIKMKGKGDCGGGTVYLEKVEESDFEKEDFLKGSTSTKKTNEPRKLPSGKNFEADRIEEQKLLSVNKKNIIKPKTDLKTIAKSNVKPATNSIPKKVITTPKLVAKTTTQPASYQEIIKTPKKVIVKKTKADSIIATKAEPLVQIKKLTENSIKKIVPEATEIVLLERENKLANKISVDFKEIVVEFYDNGEVDNDTISVYKDNKPVILNARLSTRPIKLSLKFDEVNTFYELITVAENLGDIPPNTALMVINYGKKRHEVFLTSDEKRNAKVVIAYKENNK